MRRLRPELYSDRTWIVELVIDGDRKDLAFNYRGVGQEARDRTATGHSGTGRAQGPRDDAAVYMHLTPAAL